MRPSSVATGMPLYVALVTVDLERYVSLQTLEHEKAVVYCLDRAGLIIYVNPAWDEFARSGNAPAAIRKGAIEGTRWLDWISGAEVREWYAQLLTRVEQARGRGWMLIEGECNSPTIWRSTTTAFRALRQGHAAVEACMVVNTIVREAPIERHGFAIDPPDFGRYRDANGQILQCSGCRRVKVAGRAPAEWYFVPEWVAAEPSGVSHGLCGICRDVYFKPWLAARQDEARAR